MNKYIAENGFVFKLKNQHIFLTNTIYLGINDSIDNYEQISIEEVNKINEEEDKIIQQQEVETDNV